jgi:hypothetical protein
MAEFTLPLAALNKQWGDLTTQIGTSAMNNAEEIGAASVDYAMFSGYVTLAYLWAKMALIAQQKMAEQDEGVEFYKSKLTTARFYYARLLPRTAAHAQAALGGADTMMALSEDEFAFS